MARNSNPENVNPETGEIGGEIVKYTRTFSDDDLREISSYDDLMNRASDLGLTVPTDVPEIGTGFTMLEDKARLVRQPFVIVEWRFLSSDDYRDADGNPAEFVAVTLITKAGEKYLMTDGSTGICRQLRQITDRRASKGQPGVSPTALLPVPGGLRSSVYFANQKTGERANKPGDGPDWTRAETFYLSE